MTDRSKWRPGRNLATGNEWSRDPQRIEVVISKLRKTWHAYPQFRLGQLLVNALGDNAFYVEDDEAADRLDQLFGELNQIVTGKLFEELIEELDEISDSKQV